MTGSHLQTTTVVRIQGKAIDAPTVSQTTPVYDLAQGKIVWRSVLSSNLVYSAGTNDIANVPAQSAAFYRAMYGTNSIMPVVLDQQIVGWFGRDGLTIPMGTITILQSNLTANLRMYDGSASAPALSTVSDPDTGWYRPAEDTWRYVAAGNIVADFGVGGITMGSGKTITGLTGYAPTSTVGAIAARTTILEGQTNTWKAAAALAATAWQNPADATNWTWTSNGRSVTLTSYTGPDNVILPDMLDGLPVTRIGNECFYVLPPSSLTITNVVNTRDIVDVGDGAFGACANLESLDLPSVITIGQLTFSGCTALRELRLASVRSIGSDALWNCENLTAVYFQESPPNSDTNLYVSASSVINYVASPTATGWGTNWNDRPVVRLPADGDELKMKGTVLLISGGTNLLWVAAGVTNRVVMEAWSE